MTGSTEALASARLPSYLYVPHLLARRVSQILRRRLFLGGGK
jgi:hypothetical protein